MSERAMWFQQSLPLSERGNGLTIVMNQARLVIFSISNHQHMSGRGHFMSRVTHVQSDLAARICVIAVAFTHSL